MEVRGEPVSRSATEPKAAEAVAPLLLLLLLWTAIDYLGEADNKLFLLHTYWYQVGTALQRKFMCNW